MTQVSFASGKFSYMLKSLKYNLKYKTKIIVTNSKQKLERKAHLNLGICFKYPNDII